MKTAEERFEDALREIGILLIAFAPLDVALNRHQGGTPRILLLFLGLGTSLFTGALLLEAKRATKSLSNSRYLLIFLLFGVSLMAATLIKGIGGH